mmetsp:Transcript_20449/g.57994  ORF Transcript_20449/g.57994 Transcript_20449/m.57994 type:complete len:352 (+) Transcript_20449:1467-2522(+)
MPSVMYLITVEGPVQSSNRIVYPTSWPRSQPNSSATRLATDIAATRRGCVQPIIPLDVRPISAMYCVICVVLPLPVSPITTKHWWSRIASINSLRSCAIGRPARCSLIVLVETCPNDNAAFFCCCFQADSTWLPAKFTERSSWAKCRSPASGIGSSHGRFKSFGMPSMSAFACAVFSSRRSFASWPWVRAALCNEPSGLATIFMGEASRAIVDCPRRKAGSCVFNSISMSSSTSSRPPAARAPPRSASYVGNSSGGKTPEAASCLASNNSGEVSRFGARPPDSLCMSSSRTPGLIIGLLRVFRSVWSSRSSRRLGCKSLPDRWSHSFMDSDTRCPARPTTFTKTRCLLCTC